MYQHLSREELEDSLRSTTALLQKCHSATGTLWSDPGQPWNGLEEAIKTLVEQRDEAISRGNTYASIIDIAYRRLLTYSDRQTEGDLAFTLDYLKWASHKYARETELKIIDSIPGGATIGQALETIRDAESMRTAEVHSEFDNGRMYEIEQALRLSIQGTLELAQYILSKESKNERDTN